MLKTISAALLAVSVLAAPAMAGTARSPAAPAAKFTQMKPGVLNANAKMGRHHRHGYHHRHYRHHRHHR
jgi:hypothetical protein